MAVIVIDPNLSNNNFLPHEDLVMFAKLTAKRFGRTIIDVGDTIETSSSKGTGDIYFLGFDPNSNSLTTNWTDAVGFKTDDTVDYETFGIVNIEIKFDASFVPRVNINFVDIRGQSLIQKGKQSNYEAFFSMPYPLFELTVKGFLGKAVRYHLHLLKFNSRFDSNTGNFEIKTEFVGYTFALLADIPVGALLMGPYLNNRDGITEGTDSDFKPPFVSKEPKTDRGITTIELLEQIKRVDGTLTKFSQDSSEFNQKKSIDTILTTLKRIKQLYVEFKQTSSEKKVILDVEKFNWKDVIENLPPPEGVARYTNETYYEQVTYGDFFNKVDILIKNINLQALENQFEKLEHILLYKDSFSKAVNPPNVFNFEFFLKKINDYEALMKQRQSALCIILNEQIDLTVTDLLGVKPTIKNIFDIILTDAELFLIRLQELGAKVDKKQAERKKLSGGTLVKDSNTDYIYPFPLYTEHRVVGGVDSPSMRREVRYLGNLRDAKARDNPSEFNDAFPELVFVENFTNLSMGLTERLNNIVESDGWFPTNILESAEYLFDKHSPYLNITQPDDTKKKIIDRLITMIGISHNMAGSKEILTLFGKLEANNYWYTKNSDTKDFNLTEGALRLSSGDIDRLYNNPIGRIVSDITITTDGQRDVNLQNDSIIKIEKRRPTGNGSINSVINEIAKEYEEFNFEAISVLQINSILQLFNIPFASFIYDLFKSSKANVSISNDSKVPFFDNLSTKESGIYFKATDEFISYVREFLEPIIISEDNYPDEFKKKKNNNYNTLDLFKVAYAQDKTLTSVADNVDIESMMKFGFHSSYALDVSSINSTRTTHDDFFSTSFFTGQNNNAKALLFLTFFSPKTYNIWSYKFNRMHGVVEVPYLFVLQLGGLFFREQVGEIITAGNVKNHNGEDVLVNPPPNLWSIYDFYNLKSKFINFKDMMDNVHPIQKQVFIDEFLSWANNKFSAILAELNTTKITQTTLNSLQTGNLKDRIPEDVKIKPGFWFRLDNASHLNVRNMRFFYIDERGSESGMVSLKNLLIDVRYIKNPNWKTWDITNFTNPDEVFKSNAEVDDVKVAIESFRSTLQTLKDGEEQAAAEKKKSTQTGYDNEDVLLDRYMYMKNIYEKWIAGSSVLSFQRNGKVRNLRDMFYYVDRGMNPIGETAMLNLKEITILDSRTVNLYEFIVSILSKSYFEFHALPNYIGVHNANLNTDDKIMSEYANAFVPHPILDEVVTSPAFVCMHVGELSHRLDLENVEYKNDSFNITKNPPTDIAGSDAGGNVYAFEVNFGSENQSIFKSIEINQEEFKETMESLVVEDAIAQGKNTKEAFFYGQDLYNVYRQRSYTCKVEMLGNMMIQPLMYFQLNGVPMFHGAYLITSVSHTINPHNVQTNFVGSRIPEIPSNIITSYSTFSNLEACDKETDIGTSQGLTWEDQINKIPLNQR